MSDRRAVLCGLALAALSASEAAGQDGYQRPPKAVTDILDAPAPPAVSVSPARDRLLLVQTDRYPPIADLAEPTLRLAGLRINPRTNGPARPPRVSGLTLVPLDRGDRVKVELPPGKVGFPRWSPDGKRFAVAVTAEERIGLWVGDLTGKLVQVPGVVLNGAVGEPFQWLPGGQRLLVQLILGGRSPAAPAAPLAPPGPVIQESSGKAAPVRTFQDLLKDPHDEALFEYHTTSQLAIVEPPTERRRVLGKPGLYVAADFSPSGRYLLVSRVKRPFSYLYPYSSFPRAVEVWDAVTGDLANTVADLPLQDKVPIEGVPTGPRSVRWVPTAPHTLTWVEALDEGDPRKKVPHRDALFVEEVNGREGRREVLKLEHRFRGLDFFHYPGPALVRDYDRDRKWSRTFRVNFDPDAGAEPKLLFERSTQDRYNDPGTPVTVVSRTGQRVLLSGGEGKNEYLYLVGPGASPKGDRPFLDRFDLTTGKADRLWQSGDGEYAEVAAVLSDDAARLLIRRETPTVPPNYFLRTGADEKKLTDNRDPAPELRQAKKQLVTTKRPDGVTISFTLYTPPGYKDGERLPTVFWAYPREFATADTAGQVSGTPYDFTTVTGASHLFFLTQGYAVMDEVSVPIVGPPETANDTYIEQLVSSAAAAVDKAVEMGVVDRDRIGATGHSYGAFMTANLLAHSDLFRAGIARSGAYNRTLTPFGFQNERRTFWEAPQVYGKMSPFYHADKIDEPLLLIHGAADNNPGTFPVQSERMYAAVRGNGGTVRLVMLPHESHGYEARESVEHVLYEQITWFDRYVKNAKPRKKE